MADIEMREIATARSDPYVSAYQSVLAPTDSTLRARGGGRGLELYDEIRRDPHAFAIMQKRALEVVSREWRVEPASDARLDKKAADLVERQFKAINFDRLTRGLMGAVMKGFATAEVVWEFSGTEWMASAVKVKKQRRFKFTLDGELRLVTRANMIDGEPVPDRKFLVHRHSIDDDDDDPYGVGLGSVLFWPAWFKRQVLAHWLRGSERFASPTVKATYQGGYNKDREATVLDAIRRMANDAGIAVPDNVELGLLEAARGGGGDMIEKLARYLDELMSVAVLGETLSTTSGERGARSLGEVHNEVRIAIAKADSDLISQTLKGTIIRWLVELNYPGAGLPDVWRDFDEPEDLDGKVQRDKTLHDMGYRPTDVSYINDTYGGEWVVKDPAPPPPEAQPAPVPAPRQRAASPDGKVVSLFADRPEGDDIDTLADQLAQLGDAPIGAMIERIRREVDEAETFEDLSTRLLALAGDEGIDDLGGLMEQAMTLAALKGAESAPEAR